MWSVISYDSTRGYILIDSRTGSQIPDVAGAPSYRRIRTRHAHEEHVNDCQSPHTHDMTILGTVILWLTLWYTSKKNTKDDAVRVNTSSTWPCWRR